MLSIQLPTVSAKDSFESCISIVDDEGLKNRLVSVIEQIVATDQEFQAHAASTSLYLLTASNNIAGSVTAKEMKAVYESRMVRHKTPGRVVYDSIKSKAPGGLCPFCVQRIADTLDHHLPKMKFPALAVAPANLIPSCRTCNETKLSEAPSTSMNQMFHPYFDSVDDDPWLAARIVQEKPATAIFFVNPPARWDPVMAARIKHTFRSFKLAELYSSHAGVELSAIRYELSRLYNAAGADGVREHLAGAADSRRHHRINSWMTAAYTAWAGSDWFCNEGFREAD